MHFINETIIIEIRQFLRLKEKCVLFASCVLRTFAREELRRLLLAVDSMNVYTKLLFRELCDYTNGTGFYIITFLVVIIK